MNLLMVDITDIISHAEVSIGSEVVLIGSSKGKEISAEDLSSLMGTIKHEILTSFKNNIPRIYIRDNNKKSS